MVAALTVAAVMAVIGGCGWGVAHAAPIGAGDPPACTAEQIGADTALTLLPDVRCVAGFALGLAQDRFVDPNDTCSSFLGCARGDFFHITTSGWVDDGRHDLDCAEHIGIAFMSPATTGFFVPRCDSTAANATYRIVQRGAAGLDVMYVQIALVALGYPLAVDGTFGAETESAVRSFQQINGLAVDGIAGPETQAALDVGPAPPAPESGVAPGVPPPCTIDVIAADTGLRIRDDVACVAGWAIGHATACIPGPDVEFDADAECEDADVFHLTVDGWAYDGVQYSSCVEGLTSAGMTPYTAEQFGRPFCQGDPPPRQNIGAGSTRSEVTAVQIALLALGYPLVPDGVYGRRTEAAVRHFQQANGLETDGIAGPATQAALRV